MFLKINEVDKEISKFSNLNELVLSVNWIEDCHSKYLPSSLKVSCLIYHLLACHLVNEFFSKITIISATKSIKSIKMMIVE